MKINRDEKQLLLAERRKDSIKMLNNEIKKLKSSGYDIDLTEYTYKEYNEKLTGYFYHLIPKKYGKILKKEGLTPSKMSNMYMYIQDAIEMDGVKLKTPRHLEGFFVGKTVRDAEVGRNLSIDINDIICRFKKEAVKNYIYCDAESYNGDESYVILICVPPELIEVRTNRTNGKWIPLNNWDVENVTKSSKHGNKWYKGR